MNQLTKLIDELFYKTILQVRTGSTESAKKVFETGIEQILASRPTCGEEQRKFLDEVENKAEVDHCYYEPGDPHPGFFLIFDDCDFGEGINRYLDIGEKVNKMDKEKIKQKIKELEALLEEPENKIDTDFKLKLNTGAWRYHGGDSFNVFITEEQSIIADKRKSAQDELLQMSFILNGEWKPNWKDTSENKYYIHFNYDEFEFCSDYNNWYSYGLVYFKANPLMYFLATASDNLKAYIKGELQ